MAALNNIAKYRILWNFTGSKNANGELESSSSPPFQLGRSKFRIDLQFKTLSTGNFACSFYLSSDFPIGHSLIRQCSYYLLNAATTECHKVANFSPYLTDWFDLGIERDKVKFLLVFAMDLNSDSHENSEFWLEGRTETLHLNMYFVSGQYCAVLRGKQYHLKFISESSHSKRILMDGLKEDKIICANFKTQRSRCDGSYRNHRVDIRSFETNCDIRDCEQINKIELMSISTKFHKMYRARISKIANIIENVNPITNIANKPFNTLQLPKRRCIPSSTASGTTTLPHSTVCSNKQLILDKIYK